MNVHPLAFAAVRIVRLFIYNNFLYQLVENVRIELGDISILLYNRQEFIDIFICRLSAGNQFGLEPFLPFSSAKIRGWLSVDGAWSIKSIPAGFRIPEPEILFERIDNKVIDEEVAKLMGKSY